MFFVQFYKKWVSVRETNIKLLLETVTCTAIAETATCIITIETVMCMMYCIKHYLHRRVVRGGRCAMPISKI